MVVCCPDGFVLEIEGLYFANNNKNDAKILESMLKRNNSLMTVLQEGDACILDRGLCDTINVAERMELRSFMPSCREKKKKGSTAKTQFTPAEAKNSRKFTLLRRVVEQFNGRIKNLFPFFENTIRAIYFKNLRQADFLSAGNMEDHVMKDLITANLPNKEIICNYFYHGL